MTDLGTFIPDPANPGLFLGNSEARGINDAGQVVGLSDDTVGSEHAFFVDTKAPRLTRFSGRDDGPCRQGLDPNHRHIYR